MPLTQATAGNRIIVTDINAYYNLLKGAAGETIVLVYNAAGVIDFQPSSDPAAGTELLRIKNNAGTVQMALSSDGKVYAADGAVGSPGLTFEGEKVTGLYRISSNTIGVSVNSAEKMRINATGVSLDAGVNFLGAAWTASSALSLTQSGAVTFTQTSARYSITGKTALAQIFLSITGAGTGNNTIILGGVPAAIAPKLTGAGRICGNFLYFRSGVTYWQGAVEATSASTMSFYTANNAGALGVLPNFATANGDTLSLNLSYEIA